MRIEEFLMKHDKLSHTSDRIYNAAGIIDDGIYDTTGINFLVANEDNLDEVKKWIKNRDKFWLASAYQTNYFILYETEPPKFTGKRYGNGFNYGSTNMLTECPESILILAEDD